MPNVLESLRTQRSSKHEQRAMPDSLSWIREYEKRPDSIFKYYSVKNEAEFLRKTNIPESEKRFYVEENVKRFYGEFVGKLPYTTIPYMIKPDGFDYAGMHVMDSYRNAAELGGEREKAETAGFGKIEEVFAHAIKNGEKPPTAFWISPPKDADYGFVFVLSPDRSGKTKEYILRYDEKQGKTNISSDLLSAINPYAHYATDLDFIRNPQFDYSGNAEENLQAVMSHIGIDKQKIIESQQYEDTTGLLLKTWVKTYTDMMLELSKLPPGSVEYQIHELEVKAALLAMYQKAEQVKTEQKTKGLDAYALSHIAPLSSDRLFAAYVQIQKSSPTVIGGGSCPAIENNNGLPGDIQSFISNSDMMKALKNGKTLESLTKEKSFPCPKCGELIPSGQGITKCPHCGITKEQYAKEVNGKTCA